MNPKTNWKSVQGATEIMGAIPGKTQAAETDF